MKSVFVCLALLVVLNITCTRQESLNNAVNQAKVEEVLNTKVPFSQRNALFSMLTPDEKVLLWKKHLSSFLANPGLSENQVFILSEVINNIAPGIFQDNTKDNYAGKMAELEYRAKAAFPIKDYFLIFEMYSSHIEDLKADEIIGSVAAPPAAGDCYCRSNSWCGSATGSDLAMCLWNDEGSSCTSTSSGCGLIGWSACRGVCCLGANCY